MQTITANNGISNKSVSNFDISIFEIDKQKGLINLTKIAESFGKEVSGWLRNQSTKQFIKELEEAEMQNCITVIKGGDGLQGTWATKEVALEFAQWISPKFKVFCIKKLDELFQTGKVELQPTKPISTLDMLKQSNQNLSLAISEIERLELDNLAKQKAIIQKDNTISHQNETNSNLVVMKATQTRTGIKAVKCDLGVEISNRVNRVYKDLPYSEGERWKQARKDYAIDTTKTYPLSKVASLETKIEFLNWLKGKEAQKLLS